MGLASASAARGQLRGCSGGQLHLLAPEPSFDAVVGEAGDRQVPNNPHQDALPAGSQGQLQLLEPLDTTGFVPRRWHGSSPSTRVVSDAQRPQSRLYTTEALFGSCHLRRKGFSLQASLLRCLSREIHCVVNVHKLCATPTPRRPCGRNVGRVNLLATPGPLPLTPGTAFDTLPFRPPGATGRPPCRILHRRSQTGSGL